MRLAFLSNYFNHHQKPLSDEFFNLLGGGNFYFIETTDIPEFRKQLGYKELTAPYLIKYCHETIELVKEILSSFDVVIYSSAPLDLIKARYNEGKLTFCYSERRYKTLSRYLFYPVYTYRSHYLNKGYLLCASAYAPIDYYISGMSRKKCFRWGYFPEAKTYENVNDLITNKSISSNADAKVSILWVGRLIKWKHPEAVINMAQSLKREGYSFSLDIIGNGEMESSLKESIEKKGLGGCVHMLGGMASNEVRSYMERADVFLLTSNRQEGWGAVLNESMNSACAVIVNNKVGAAPYLVTDGLNGMIYHNGDVGELTKKVKYLIDNPSERRRIQESAYNTIQEQWNAKKAAQNLISLVKSLQREETAPINEGPGSLASLYNM